MAGERLACLIVPLSRMRGVVRLPFAVLFSEDALGGSLSGATDRAVFSLILAPSVGVRPHVSVRVQPHVSVSAG